MYFDPRLMLLMLVAMALGGLTQGYIKSTFRKWGNVPLSSGMSGAAVARRILDSNGLSAVPVKPVAGTLSDHYDPRSRELALSGPVFGEASVAAAGVAAHEAGHAIQHEQRYVWGELRTALVPVANFGSSAAGVLIVMGFFIGLAGLVWLGIVAYAMAVLFQVVTLPVEINASRRAMQSLEVSGVMDPSQLAGARQVLTAAALTYVAAALISIMYLVYYLGFLRRD